MSRYARKPCKQCGTVKALRGFYRHPTYRDGHMNTCKACVIKNVAENRALKADYYREKKREWSARPENVAKRKANRQTPHGRASHRESNRIYRAFKRAVEARV